MFRFLKNRKNNNRFTCRQGGMTYVELIVVLSIFSVMTSVVLFNYGKFTKQVELKNLANDVALQIVKAQKDSSSGKLVPGQNFTCSGAGCIPKPAYGVYFDTSSDLNKKKFVYFGDFNNNSKCNDNNGICNDEIIYNFDISNNNKVSNLMVDGTSFLGLNFLFKRTDSSVILRGPVDASNMIFSCVQITISDSSSNPNQSFISVYPSGRVSLNKCP